MRWTPAFAALNLCLLGLNAQDKTPTQEQAPIKVEKIPAVPMVNPATVQDRVSSHGNTSSLGAHMMPFVAPIILDSPGIKSILVLANASTAGTTATVTLFSVDGKKSVSRALTFAPHEKKEVSLSPAQEDTDSNERWGSVSVQQDSQSMGMVIAGQVLITDQRASTPAYVDEELAAPDSEGSTTLTAVTDQSEGRPIVGVTNLSDLKQLMIVTCIRSANNPMVSRIEIAAHATTIFEACTAPRRSTLADYVSSIESDDAQGVYGIKLDGDGAPGSLAAFALAPHYRGRDIVFSSVPFYDPETIHSSSVVFAGVPIGTQDALPEGVYIPRLSVANFSDTSSTFSIQLVDTPISPVVDGDGNTHPPLVAMHNTVTIPPHQTGEYVFSGQEAQNGLLHSVIVTSDAKGGTFEAKLVSRSTGVLYQVELLAKDTLDLNNAGVHPWTLRGDSKSHVVLFNHSKRAAKVGIFISTSAQTVWSSEIALASFETREISIDQLRNEQVPDDHGNRIPLKAEEGVADWRTPDNGVLTGRLMVTSHDGAMARNYSCGTYYGVCDLYFETFSNFVGVGGDGQLYEALADYCNFNPNAPNRCVNGTPMSGLVNYYWTVGATNIVTLNSSNIGQKPTLQGVSGGIGYANVEVEAGSCTATGSGTPIVQVPTASRTVTTPTEAVSAPSNGAATDCPSGQAGWNRVISKIVTDQETPPKDIVAAGQNITETFTLGTPNAFNITSVGTGQATSYSDGSFGDRLRLCSTLCPASTGQTDGSQTFTDVWNTHTYTLAPNSIVWSCSSITVNGQ